MTEVLISEINVGTRYRTGQGDIKSLADSISLVGLLHPIVIGPDKKLIAGFRRLQAFKFLQRDHIPATIASHLDTALAALKAERDENVCREPMSPLDQSSIYDAILTLEKPQAQERKQEGRKKGGGDRKSEKRSVGTSHKAIPADKSRDKAAKAAGTSAKTMAKVNAIKEAAGKDARYQPFMDKLIKPGAKVDGIYKAYKAEEKKKDLEQARQKITKKAKASLASVCDIRHCSMAELFASGIKPDIVISDPPYPKEYIPVYGELAALCAKAKIPTVAVMCGQSYLPEIFTAMCQHLTYRWTMAYLTPGGQSVQQWKKNVNTFWKPILIFGEDPEWIGDVVRSNVNDNDKRFHGWGQSESGMRDLVEKLTRPGQLVCDPFVGGGTTAVVCLAQGRRVVGCDIDAESVKNTIMRCEALNANS